MGMGETEINLVVVVDVPVQTPHDLIRRSFQRVSLITSRIIVVFSDRYWLMLFIPTKVRPPTVVVFSNGRCTMPLVLHSSLAPLRAMPDGPACTLS